MLYTSLTTASAAVTSFNGRSNTISGVHDHVTTVFAQTFEQIELAAMSQQESRAYALILSRVAAVESLALRGVEAGCKLRGGWEKV